MPAGGGGPQYLPRLFVGRGVGSGCSRKSGNTELSPVVETAHCWVLRGQRRLVFRVWLFLSGTVGAGFACGVGCGLGSCGR